jgi:hypothetical protein
MPPREPAPFWEMLDTAERAPRTSAWELRFLAGIRAQIDEQDQPWLTDDQSRVLAGIALKAGVALPDGVQDLLAGRPGLLMAFAVGALGDPRLTAWEDGFLCSLVETGWICRPLSDKQLAVLDKIAGKVASLLPGTGEGVRRLAG